MDLNRIMREVYSGEKEEELLPADFFELSLDEFWNEDISSEEDVPEISFKTKRTKKAAIAAGAALGAVLLAFLLAGTFKVGCEKIQQTRLYNRAVKEMEQGNYACAIEYFEGIKQESKNYSEARSNIRRLTNISTYMRQAQEFYDNDELAYALEKVNSVDMLISGYEPANELREKILIRMDEKRAEADGYINQGIKLVSEGSFIQAKEKLDLADRLYPDYINSDKLRETLKQKAAELNSQAENLYSQGKINEAAQANKQALTLCSELAEAKSLEESLSDYFRADETAKKAVELLNRRSYDDAEEKMNEAIGINSLISEKYAADITRIAEGKRLKEISDAYLEKIEITDISVVDGFEDTLPDGEAVSPLNIMFTIENKTEDIFCFNVYWCTLFNGVSELEPVPFSDEQTGSVVRILPDGIIDDELAGDLLYMKQGEKYKILIRFNGTKQELKGYDLYYNDFNENPVVKADLFGI